MAGRFERVIAPGMTPVTLTAEDKAILGVRSSVSIFAILGWIGSSAYEQAIDSSPKYGQTGRGYAQRLGAAAARDTSEDLFSTSILAPILRQDPRYFRKGPGHGFFARALYAGTRPLVGRTDGGRSTVNLSLMGGNLAGAALTQAYYPASNRGWNETLKTFGGSMAGSAVGGLITEFFVRETSF